MKRRSGGIGKRAGLKIQFDSNRVGVRVPPSARMFFMYVLKSLRDENLYIGLTENVEARLIRHNQGKVPSTKYRRPLQLIYTEECPDRKQARKREKFLKSGPGHQEIKKILEGRVPTSSG